MLLTIALLTKNSEDTVRYALKSILKQNIPLGAALELIVIDGYSTDNTLKIVEDAIGKLRARFNHQFVRHVIRQERVSIGYARNLALKETSGDWILWVDSDNVLAQDYISKALQEIEKCKDMKTAVLYPFKVITIPRDNNLASKLIMCYGILQSYPSQQLRGLAEKLIRKEPIQKILPYTAMQGSLCKTSALRAVGGFNNCLLAAEDIDVYLRILNQGFSMRAFNSTLYSFSRRTLSAWFKQAMLWGYGKELMQIHGSNFPRNRKAQRLSIDSLVYNLIIHTLMLLLLSLVKGVKVCGVLGLLMPLLYIYRRSGYIKGYLCASEKIQKRVRRIDPS
ncbi:MAG: glycosyltransferase [Candidatus Bathyarchaeia archaeon]